MKLIKKKKNSRTRVPLEYFQGTRVPQFFFFLISVHYNSIVQKSSFTSKLDF